MKVLVISPKFHPVVGGGETFVLSSVQKMHEAGVDVSIAVEPLSERRAQDYSFPVHQIRGLSDSHLDVITAPSGLHDLLSLLKPDVIHVHGYFALLAVRLTDTKVPIVASIHSTPVWGERIIGGMDSFEAEYSFAKSVSAFAKPRIMTAANEVYAQAAREIAPESSLVEVFPYPVDLEHFKSTTNNDLRFKLGLNDSDCMLLLPSRIIARKGILEMVTALSLLPENFFLCLPGAFNPLDMRYWASVCGSEAYKLVKNRIRIPDKQTLYTDMPDLYAASDIIVMPSYYEGAPVATVEAMASGKPFVGADSQGINSIIRNNINGLLVPPKNSALLAKAIQKVHQDHMLKNKLSTQALKDVVALSWDEHLPSLLQLYESVAQKEYA